MCKYLILILLSCLCFSCRHSQTTEDNTSLSKTQKTKGQQTHSFKEKKTVTVKKAWIRETFPKDFTRPSILQSIKPVLVPPGLLIQGNKVNGISAYTLDKGEKKWFFPVKGGLAGNVSVADGFVFFGGADGFIYALYLKTGNVLWKHHTKFTHVSAPTIWKDHLYFASFNKIHCLNKKTGESVWTYSTQIKTTKFTVEGIARPLIGSFTNSTLIYFKASDDSLIALNMKGLLKWKRRLSDSTSRFTSAVSAPVMGKICLYSASLEAGLYCLNPKTGKIIWKTTVGSHGNLLLSGSWLFYPSNDGRVIALDQKSGKQIWSHKVPKSIATSLTLYKDILIYGEYSGDLRFISLDTGKELSSFSFGRGMAASPVVSVIHSALYFISNSGWLYKLSITKGS